MSPNNLKMIADYLEFCVEQDDVNLKYAKNLRRHAKDIESCRMLPQETSVEKPMSEEEKLHNDIVNAPRCVNVDAEGGKPCGAIVWIVGNEAHCYRGHHWFVNQTFEMKP